MDNIVATLEVDLKSLEQKVREAGPWFHSIDLGNGIVTPGLTPPHSHSDNVEIYLSDVKGKSVLDVGAWDGQYSFEAKRRGARDVLAADYFCWAPGGPGNKAAFELANQVLGLDVRSVFLDIDQLTEQTIGRFDIVLYNGIWYHAYDSLTALKNLSKLCNETLTLETLLDLRHEDRPAMVFFPGEIAAGEKRTNGWGPNLRLLYDVLEYNGFEFIEYYPTPGHERTRAIFKAHKPGVKGNAERRITRDMIPDLAKALSPHAGP